MPIKGRDSHGLALPHSFWKEGFEGGFWVKKEECQTHLVCVPFGPSKPLRCPRRSPFSVVVSSTVVGGSGVIELQAKKSRAGSLQVGWEPISRVWDQAPSSHLHQPPELPGSICIQALKIPCPSLLHHSFCFQVLVVSLSSVYQPSKIARSTVRFQVVTFLSSWGILYIYIYKYIYI